MKFFGHSSLSLVYRTASSILLRSNNSLNDFKILWEDRDTDSFKRTNSSYFLYSLLARISPAKCWIGPSVAKSTAFTGLSSNIHHSKLYLLKFFDIYSLSSRKRLPFLFSSAILLLMGIEFNQTYIVNQLKYNIWLGCVNFWRSSFRLMQLLPKFSSLSPGGCPYLQKAPGCSSHGPL